MRRGFTFLLLILLISPPAIAEEVHVCWADQTPDPFSGRPTTITRCRVAGEIVDYASVGQVPLFLYPDLGVASNGNCWYWRSVFTGWVFITSYGDGTAVLGFDPGLGGPLIVDGTYPVCISEPADAVSSAALAWDLAKDHIHDPPGPLLNPRVPWGLTGAETHLGLTPPLPFTESIVDPLGQVLEVQGQVAAVNISWGDGAAVTFPPEMFGTLTGYPDGAARHMYEVKTCTPPGSTPRCHPSLASYGIEVRYLWMVQWRLDSGDWVVIAVPDTVTSVAYPVREVIAVLDVRRP